MSHSIHSADRGARLKIVIAALTIGIAIVGSATIISHQFKACVPRNHTDTQDRKTSDPGRFDHPDLALTAGCHEGRHPI